MWRAGRAVREGLVEFYRSDNLTFASSIAYYALLSMFPFALLAVALVGRVTADVADREVVVVREDLDQDRTLGREAVARGEDLVGVRRRISRSWRPNRRTGAA